MFKENLTILLIIFSLLFENARTEFSGLLTILQYVGLLSYNATTTEEVTIPLSELGQSIGACRYNFEQVIYLHPKFFCEPDDKYIQHILNARQRVHSTQKPPIKVKCLQPDNTTTYDNTMVVKTPRDLLNLLKPIGNATKRHEAGSCVVILFCTPSSLACATISPLITMLPLFYPTLRFAYIDSYKFQFFNAEFGIVGLPTLLLFHQGRPIVKFYAHDKSYLNFVKEHTGIEPLDKVMVSDNLEGPLPTVPIEEPDYILAWAWLFIVICALNYLRRTPFWNQIVEMVKNNWHESEEIQMEMVD